MASHNRYNCTKMRTMLSAVCALLLVASALGQAGKSVDDLIGEVFPSPDEDCECVHQDLCSRKSKSINTNGEGIIEPRLRGGSCENFMEVCCRKSDRLAASPRCGQRNPDGVGILSQANYGEAEYGEFPWMVALLREEAVDGINKRLIVYLCGGSLIHPKVVLTSAHCVAGKSPAELKVRAGQWDAQKKDEQFPYQERLVSKVITHPKYETELLYFDIALLILQEPVTAAENVDFVCLPSQNQLFDLTRCFASGWGKDVFGQKGQYQVILKKVELPIVPKPKCLEALRKTRLGPEFQLHESFICAGGEGAPDTCKGDGGSPLVCPLLDDPQRYQQAGIVAWGIGCGENRVPGVYANVALFRNWIDQQMNINQFDNSSYSYENEEEIKIRERELQRAREREDAQMRAREEERALIRERERVRERERERN